MDYDFARAPKTACAAAVLVIAAVSIVGAPAAWADEMQVPAQVTEVVAEAAVDDPSVAVGDEAPTEGDALGVGEGPESVGNDATNDAPDEPLVEAVTPEEVTAPVLDPGTEQPLVEPEDEAKDDKPFNPVTPPAGLAEASPTPIPETLAPVEEGEDEHALVSTVTASRIYVSTVGERIDLRVTVRNSGRAVLTDIAVVNNLTEGNAHCGVRTLAPKESVTCTLAYRVTNADLAGQRLGHELIATGETPENGEVATSVAATTYIAPIPPEPAAPLRIGN